MDVLWHLSSLFWVCHLSTAAVISTSHSGVPSLGQLIEIVIRD